MANTYKDKKIQHVQGLRRSNASGTHKNKIKVFINMINEQVLSEKLKYLIMSEMSKKFEIFEFDLLLVDRYSKYTLLSK